MGTISLPIPHVDYHRGGHPWAFSYGQPDPCPFCGATRAEQQRADEERRAAFWRDVEQTGRGDEGAAVGRRRRSVSTDSERQA